jgi:hypothetical protein
MGNQKAGFFQSVSGKLTEILVWAGFTNNLRTYAWEPRNRVFLRKYLLATRRFGKNPVSLVGVRAGLNL